MLQKSKAARFVVASTVVAIAGCSKARAVDAPPAPAMPAGGQITSDDSFPPAEVGRVASVVLANGKVAGFFLQ